MELWIASANENEIKEALDYPIQGVITNPTVIADEKGHWKDILTKLNTIGDEPIHLQLISTVESEMLEQVKEFKEIITNRELIIKVPLCKDGLKIIPQLKKIGSKVNITTICNLNQAVVALESDIDYLSVYVGRVSDNGGDGFKLVKEIREYVDFKKKETKIIAASIRNLEQMKRITLVGADAIAIPFSLLNSSLEDNITTSSINKFAEDWSLIEGGKFND